MFETSDLTGFELSTNLSEATKSPVEVPIEVAPEPPANLPRTSSEALEPSPEVALAVVAPKSARELAEAYKVSDRTIQTWFKTVCNAYSWLNLPDLQTGTSNQIRYTPLFQQLLADFRSSGLTAAQWIAGIQSANADLLQPQEAETVTPAASQKLEDAESNLDDKAIDVPWTEIGGRVGTASTTQQAAPIVQFTINNLQIELPTADTSALDAQSEQMRAQTSQAFTVLKDFVSADLKAKLGTVLSQNAQVISAIQNAAAIEAIQDLSVGKSQAAPSAPAG
jgi:hypothetical protein